MIVFFSELIREDLIYSINYNLLKSLYLRANSMINFNYVARISFKAILIIHLSSTYKPVHYSTPRTCEI